MPMPKKWLVALITRLLKPSTTNDVTSLGMILETKVNNNQSFYKILQEPNIN
jgi:hypothetical protein